MQTDYSIPAHTKTSPTHTRGGKLSPTLASVVKSAIVDALALILAWKPRLAMLLGKVVTVLWPSFWRV
jgi:hypothetical protein